MSFRMLIYGFILVSLNAEAQSTFDKKYTPTLEQYGRELFVTSDNGFFLQGTIEQGWRNCYLIRTDSLGDTLWTKTFGTDSIQFYAYDMTITSDGGYLICGDYQEVSTYPSMDSYIQKIDSLGNQVWFNLFGWPTSQNGNKDFAQFVKTLDDGSIIVGGTTRDYYVDIGNYIPVGQGYRSYLAKFDSLGIMLQIKTISLILDTLWGQSYQALDIETIGNRIYWLGIPAAPYFPNGGGTTLIAFDSNLDTLYTISNGLDDYYGLSKTSSNDLILFGQGLLTKRDTTGAIIWTTPNSSVSFPNEFIEFGGGEFASIGGTYHISPFFGDFYSVFSSFNQDVYLNFYNNSGLLTVSNIFNPPSGINKNLGYNLVHTNDNGFAFVGYSGQSIWLVKTDSTGNFSTSLSDNFDQTFSIQMFPNPTTGLCFLNSTIEISSIEIFNIVGERLISKTIDSKSYELNIDLFSEGIYYVRIIDQSERITIKKLVKVN